LYKLAADFPFSADPDLHRTVPLVFHPTFEIQSPGLVTDRSPEAYPLDPAVCPYFILNMHLDESSIKIREILEHVPALHV
jgi:hypothetical protein